MPNDLMQPLGLPHVGAGHVVVVTKDNVTNKEYQILFFPDPHNQELRNNNKAMQFYYLPMAPRLAIDERGKYKFSMQVFKSDATEDTTLDTEGIDEEAGSFLSFAITNALPSGVLANAMAQLKQKLETEYNNNRQDKLFGLFAFKRGVDRDFNETNIRPVQLANNKIVVHKISPVGNTSAADIESWTFNVQGEGEGNTTSVGENPISIITGRNAASLIKSSLESGNNNIAVESYIKYKGYIPESRISVTADFKKVHTYFSSKLNVNTWGINLKWEHEYESLVTQGAITADVFVDEQFDTAATQKLREVLLNKAIDKAYSMVETAIFNKEPKTYTPATEVSGSKKFLFWDIGGIGLSIKSATEINQINVSQVFTFSGAHLFDEAIGSTLDALTKASGAKAKKELEDNGYVTEVSLDDDFSKIHFIANLNGDLAIMDETKNIINESAVDKVAIEVAYVNSKGALEWRGSGRKIGRGGTPYIKTTSRSGKEIDAIFPATWYEDEDRDNSFVFDFAKFGDKPSNVLKVRKQIMYVKNQFVKLKDKKEVLEIEGTNVFVPLESPEMLNYSISTEPLFACDKLEITIKGDQVPAKTFKFDENNSDQVLPYRAWYENGYQIKPTKYKLKYTCSGKIGKKTKKVTINVPFTTIDYEQGELLIQIPEGKEAQNADIQKIREPFLS